MPPYSGMKVRHCLRFVQVIERLITDWCGAPVAPPPPATGGSEGGTGPTSPSGQQPAPSQEAVPGFRRFAIEHFAGEACVSGLLRAAAGGLFDARDSATVSLLGEVRMGVFPPRPLTSSGRVLFFLHIIAALVRC